MPEVAVFDSEAVIAAVSPSAAIDAVRDGFVKHAQGEWSMPAKLYVDSPPHGDFRAMPAVGDGLAILKWVTSFPHNPDRGLPVVTGALLVSDAGTGELLAVVDTASVTSLRTGAAAAVSATALAREDASSVGVIGCGVNGAWSARCLAAAGYGPGICFDVRAESANALAEELGWRTGEREEAAAADVVVTVTPGEEPVLHAPDLHRGQHVAALGADASGKSELTADAVLLCRLFCDEWEQARGGGELSGPLEAGIVDPLDVTELGAVLTGEAEGRRASAEITLFDSTGLAIQDLAIVRAVHQAWGAGALDASVVTL